MMCHRTQPRYNRGVSMLEVLFAIVILSIALLATARLHAMVTQDGSYAKARGVAANLAQEKLDDLKSFTSLVDNAATTTVNECAAPVYCFSEMAANAGGKENSAGALALPSGNITNAAYSYTYNRTWTVTNYYICAPGGAPGTSNCASPNTKPYPDFKSVTLTVSWTDEKNAAQSVVMQATIYSSDPASGHMAGAPSGGGKPLVSYTPIGVPDAVPVPIMTGGDKYKESSKPVPEVSASDTGAEVSFDAVSYAKNGSGGYNTAEKEEFVTASCECQFDPSGTGGYAPSRMVWNGAGLEAKIGDQINEKPVGTAVNGQSEFCTACCRDHHDVDDDTQPKYDPDRPDSEYVDGDHKHYWYANCVAGTLGKTSGCNSADKNPADGYGVVDSGAYLESCRFKRVGGFWRVWQDWRQVKMTVIPYDYLPTYQTAYVDMIVAVVENTIRTDSGNGSTSIPTLSNRNIEFTAQGQVKQLLGRAVYVDRIYQADDPATLDEVYYDKLVELIGADKDWLNIVPFYEANLTLLIDWSSSDATKASVTSQPIVNINDVSNGYYNSYSRGKVTGVATGTATITATARLHNTGVTGGINTASPSYGISGYDNTGPLSDSISVTVPGSSTGVGISGKFIRANASVNFGTLQTITGATCTLQASIGNELPYTCTVTSGTNVTLSYSSSASGYDLSPASQAFGVVTSAQVAKDVIVYGPTVKISGTLSKGSGNPNMNKVTVNAVSVSGTVSCAVTVSSYTCALPNSASGFTGTIVFSDSDSSSTYTFSPVSPHSYTNQRADAFLNVTVNN